MADGKRPGGLTALAVLNFVFGGLGVIGTLGAFALVTAAKAAVDHVSEVAVENGAKVTHTAGPSIAIAYVIVLLSALSAALLITSGVGYLKQKRFMGRTLGTVYALVSIGSTVLSVVFAGTGVGLFTILFSVYPILTLVMVNTTFKDDLVL